MLGSETTVPQNVPTAAPSGLDPNIISLAKAIRDNESGGNFQARGADGEVGAYQITHGLWDGVAPKYGITTPLESATPEEQNKFTYQRLADLQQQGYNPGQIASIWNHGSPDPTGVVGTSAGGASYNTPQYVDNVYNSYMKYKGEGQPAVAGASTQQAPTYGATFPYQSGDNPLVAGAKALGNLPSSAVGFGKGIADMVFHPIQTIQNLGGIAIGGIEELTSDQESDQTAAFDSFVTALKQRYGGLDQLTNTAVNDPFGFGTDIVGLLAGGAGLVGKTAELGELGSRAAQVAMRPGVAAAERVTAPFAASANLETEQAAARLGMNPTELPASARSTSPAVAGIESLAGKAVGGKGVMERANTAADRLTGIADQMVRDAGGAEDLAGAGRALGEGLNKFVGAFKAEVGGVYNKFLAKVGDELGRTDSTIETIKDIIARKKEIGDKEGLKFFQDRMAALKNKRKPPAFNVLKQMKTDISARAESAFGDPFAKANMVQLKRLGGALEKDLYATIKDSATSNRHAAKLVSEYDAAKAAYRNGIQMAKTTLVKKIMKLTTDRQWDRILPALLKPSASMTDVQNIMKMTGNAGASQIRATLLEDIFKKATGANEKFMPASIEKRLVKDGERIKQILTPEQFQGLQDIATVAKSLGKLTKVTGGSQTAFLLEHLAQGGLIWWGVTDLLTGNIVGAAQKLGGALGTYGASRFVASEAGQRLLTHGLLNHVNAQSILAEVNRSGLKPPSNGSALPAAEANVVPEAAPENIDQPSPVSNGEETENLPQ